MDVLGLKVKLVLMYSMQRTLNSELETIIQLRKKKPMSNVYVFWHLQESSPNISVLWPHQ